MNRKMNKLWKKVTALVLTMIMVLGLALPYTSIANAAMSASVDADTSETYLDENFLGHPYSTEFSGRIWTDKSVAVAADNQFTIKYSALATAKEVTGKSVAPIDVVFVIDISGSMQDNMSNTDNTDRIVATVDALNESVETVMGMNEYTRVAVVAFSGTSQVVLPLGRYTKGTRGNGNNRVTDYFSTNGRTLYTHVYADGAATQTTKDTTVTGGTNIQRGYYEGLNILASRNDVTADINGTTVNRVPAMIFLSDGAPTFSSSSESWWNPANNGNDGPGNNPSGNTYFIGNGFKALLTGAYMKAAVNRVYNYDVSVYTVGMGIAGLSGNEKNLAYTTLAPVDHWNDTNNVASDIREAWATYITNDGPPRVNVGASNGWSYSNDYYTVNHPSGNYAQYDIDTNVDALKTFVDGYYDANDANTVADVFKQIVSEIALSTPEVPTEVKAGETLAHGGYLTYTDPIGHYMEVKGTTMKMRYAGINYNVSDSDNDGVFTFDNDPAVIGADGKGHKLNQIQIKVEEDANGFQTLTVAIPAALIPLRINKVTLNEEGAVTAHTNNGMEPCALEYSVGLIDAVYDANTQTIRLIPGDAQGAWDGQKLKDYQDYLKANFTTETGTVNFYSNLFTGEHEILNNFTVQEHTVGNATVTFEPSHTNAFYYIQERMYLYDDEGFNTLTTDATLRDDKTYYYKEVFYHKENIETKAVKRTGLQLKNVSTIKEDGTGYWYREVGSIRKNKLQLFESEKQVNATGTAQDYYASEFIKTQGATDAEGYFNVHLGNNGVLRAKVTGNLQITKVVEAKEGFVAPDKEFTFHVTLSDQNDTFNYKVVDENGNKLSAGTISNGAGTITLKDGQTAEIANLPDGTTYTVTEDAVNGFTTTKTGDTGTIEAGAVAKALFTNTYSATPIVVNENGTTADFGVKKVLKDKVAGDEDKFTFILESHRATTPMPDGATPVPNATNPTHYVSEITIDKNKINADENGTAVFGFGEIVFEQPGTYTYTISEDVPATGTHGITYSGAMYQVVVEVIDDGAGNLSKEVAMYRLRTDDGLMPTAQDGELVANGIATFTNKFTIDSVGWTPVGTKDYTDHSGTNPLQNGMFSFKIEAVTEGAPMPNETVVKNVGTQIPFNVITFTKDHIGNTPGVDHKKQFTYKFTEIIPSGVAQNGMTYDGNSYEVTVDVWYDIIDGEAELQVAPHYNTVIDGISYNRVVFFNEYKNTPITMGQNGVPVINIGKTLVGRDWKAGDAFEFVLGTEDTATKLATVNVTNANGSISGITFDKPGTYTFTLKETEGTLGGMTYDNHTAKITVVVQDTDTNGDGVMDNKLVATVSYNNGAAITEADRAVTDKATFTNTYVATESNAVSISGTKKLTGRDMRDGEFFLNVEPQLLAGSTTEYAPMGHSSRGNAAPAAQDGVESEAILLLNNVIYTKAGTYEYRIKEDIPAVKLGGITYDENTEYKVVVTVVDNLEGQLVATPSVAKSLDSGATWTPVTVQDIKFNNRYEVTPVHYSPVHLWKRLEGMELEAGAFLFKTEEVKDDVDGMTLTGNTEVTNLATGEIVFDDIMFTKAGTYQIKVTEVTPANPNPGMTYSDNELIVQFVVSDDGFGNLEVTREIVSGDVIFVNVYETEGRLDGAANLSIQKEFTGRENDQWLEDDKFTFVLVADNDAAKEGVAEGSVDMNAEAVGTPDRVTVTIENEEEALGKAFSDMVFTKAGVYTFSLYEDATGAIENVEYDKAVRTVTVTAVDNGDGTMEVTADIEGGTLTFKNVYKEPEVPKTPAKPEGPKAPKTGDYTHIGMWAALAVGTLAAGTTLIVTKKKEEEE